MVKSAIAMIELIFAIVIIGFVMLSVPAMLIQIGKSNIASLEQESILAAATRIGSVLSYRWDEEQTPSSDVNGFVFSKVLNVNSGNSAYSEVGVTNRRIGHINANGRRVFYAVDRTASIIGSEAADPSIDDIDDFDGRTINITGTTEDDYIFDFNITTNIGYANDNFTLVGDTLSATLGADTSQKANSTNLKVIEVELVNNTTGNIVRLRAYSANIGEYAMDSR